MIRSVFCLTSLSILSASSPKGDIQLNIELFEYLGENYDLAVPVIVSHALVTLLLNSCNVLHVRLF